MVKIAAVVASYICSPFSSSWGGWSAGAILGVYWPFPASQFHFFTIQYSAWSCETSWIGWNTGKHSQRHLGCPHKRGLSSFGYVLLDRPLECWPAAQTPFIPHIDCRRKHWQPSDGRDKPGDVAWRHSKHIDCVPKHASSSSIQQRERQHNILVQVEHHVRNRFNPLSSGNFTSHSVPGILNTKAYHTTWKCGTRLENPRRLMMAFWLFLTSPWRPLISGTRFSWKYSFK